MKLNFKIFILIVAFSITGSINQIVLAENNCNQSFFLSPTQTSTQEGQQYLPESAGLNSEKLNQIELIVLELSLIHI